MPDGVTGQERGEGAAGLSGSLPERARRSIRLILVATFFYWAALYLYVPVLPVYAQSMGASLTMVGIVVAAYALPQLILRIPLGLWSDSLGRQKPLVAAGIIMVGIGAVGLGLSPSPWFLAVSRVLTGAGAAAWVVFTVYLVSFYPQEGSARAIGLLNFINGGALVLTTLLGGIIADIWSQKAAFFIAAILSGVSLVIILFAGENRILQPASASWNGLSRIARKPLLISVSIMGILLQFAQFAAVWGFTPVYAAGIGITETGLGVLSMLANGFAMLGSLITVVLVNRWGNLAIIVFSLVLIGLATAAVPFMPDMLSLSVVQGLNGLGRGILVTELMALAIYRIEPRQRATAMGVYQAVYAFGMLTGPLVSGALADRYSLSLIFFLSAALLMVVAGMVFLPYLRKNLSSK